MSQNNLYSLHKIKPCNLGPENIDMSYAKVKMYTKRFRTEITAIICSVIIKETYSIVASMIIPELISNKKRLPPIPIYLAAEGSQ